MITDSKKQNNGFLKKVLSPKAKKGKRSLVIVIDKRQKFVIAIIFLSLLLFFTQYQFGRSAIITPLILALLTDLFLFWAIRNDMKENFTWNVFLLPFFYSLAFGLFYFLVPARLLFRMILTLLFAFGLYSLYLSENIFTVASIRTIQLLSGARIVSFVLTLLSFFFLANIIFTLHLFILFTVIPIAIFAFPLINQSIWSYTLERSKKENLIWTGCLSLCIVEAAAVLWFWPSSPTVIALFLTGFFYTLVGLTHVWLEKRLFRGVLWEYLWVGVIVFFVLMLFSNWGK
jgi:hypothetical protein